MEVRVNDRLSMGMNQCLIYSIAASSVVDGAALSGAGGCPSNVEDDVVAEVDAASLPAAAAGESCENRHWSPKEHEPRSLHW